MPQPENTLADHKAKLPIEGQTLRGGFTGDAWICTRCYCADAGEGFTLYQLAFEREHEKAVLKSLPPKFIHRFLLHVLPRGCAKVRYYGIWSPASRTQLEQRHLAGKAGE